MLMQLMGRTTRIGNRRLQGTSILSCRRYLYPWDLLLLLRLLHDYRLQEFRLLRTLELGAIHSNNHTNAHPQAMFSNPHIRWSRSRLDLKNPFLGNSGDVPLAPDVPSQLNMLEVVVVWV